MFSGIISNIGIIELLENNGEDLRLKVGSPIVVQRNIQLGESIAVNGVCVTVTELATSGFYADISAETLRCTTFSALQQNDEVNLEAALTPATALNGHMVSGHVDGIAQIKDIRSEGRSIRYTVSLPEGLGKYVAPKGSITIDGVSLTVNTVTADEFSVNIIPHTLDNTVIKHYEHGSAVNIEVDIIARYLERLISAAQ